MTVSLSPTAVQNYVGSLHIFLSEINEVYKIISLSAKAIVAKVHQHLLVYTILKHGYLILILILIFPAILV